MQPRISLWLLPAEPVYALLDEQIRTLARTYGGPVFVPHLTLYAPVSTDFVTLDLFVRAHLPPPFGVVCCGVGHSYAFFRSVVIETSLPPVLHDLHDALATFAGKPGKPLYRPHISLVYQVLARPVREAICRQVQVPAQCTFDRIAAVITGEGRHSWTDVQRWQEIGRWQLG
ncbi:MAG: hypothetical protein OHK0039_06270 [Bacteroidia bacterium]